MNVKQGGSQMDPRVQKQLDAYNKMGFNRIPSGDMTRQQKAEQAAAKREVEVAAYNTFATRRAVVKASQKQVDRIVDKKEELARIIPDKPNVQLPLFVNGVYASKAADLHKSTAKRINEKVGIRHEPGKYLMARLPAPVTGQVQGRLSSLKPRGGPDDLNKDYPPGTGNGIDQVKIRPGHYMPVLGFTAIGGRKEYRADSGSAAKPNTVAKPKPPQALALSTTKPRAVPAAVPPAKTVPDAKPIVTAKPSPSTAPQPGREAKAAALAQAAAQTTQAVPQTAPTPAAGRSPSNPGAGRGASNSACNTTGNSTAPSAGGRGSGSSAAGSSGGKA
jgi:hypothetical protein